ncbi:MAG: hypothetical protein R3A46_03420 [Thermomicrobiales bacterium]
MAEPTDVPTEQEPTREATGVATATSAATEAAQEVPAPEPQLPATVNDVNGEEVTVTDISRIIPLNGGELVRTLAEEIARLRASSGPLSSLRPLARVALGLRSGDTLGFDSEPGLAQWSDNVSDHVCGQADPHRGPGYPPSDDGQGRGAVLRVARR